MPIPHKKKLLAAFKKEYGESLGTRYFYAWENKKKRNPKKRVTTKKRVTNPKRTKSKNPMLPLLLGEELRKTLGRPNRGTKRKSNPKNFVGIRVIGNKVQLKVPNRNPGTIQTVKTIIKKLKGRIV